MFWFGVVGAMWRGDSRVGAYCECEPEKMPWQAAPLAVGDQLRSAVRKMIRPAPSTFS